MVPQPAAPRPLVPPVAAPLPRAPPHAAPQHAASPHAAPPCAARPPVGLRRAAADPTPPALPLLGRCTNLPRCSAAPSAVGRPMHASARPWRSAPRNQRVAWT
ncbi:hypothetical protein DEJ23_03475 [Curtobacterium sp. MCSS17_008]|nr:hypothetical protein DEJ23_03475 [Curtobacterium sp. MCSS17_008]